MVNLEEVKLSNARIASELPSGLVAVFVGATSGIGEATLKQFAKSVPKCRVYFIGRSQDAGDRIAAECKELNLDSEFIFLKGDLSLIKTVDELCLQIKSRESAVNLLFNSAGVLWGKQPTSEGIPFLYSLLIHSRNRFVLNLLPLLEKATTLRRVVSVHTGGKEGPVNKDDLAGRNVSVLSARGHMSSLVTLSLEELAKKAPSVTFIHNFPGTIKTNVTRGGQGALIYVANLLMNALPKSSFTSLEECGERHLFLAISARYPAKVTEKAANAVSLPEGIDTVKGIDGKIGSGVYSIDWEGESTGPGSVEMISKLLSDGTGTKLWEETQQDYIRITGVQSV